MNLNGIPNSNYLLHIRNEDDFCIPYSLAAFFHRDQVKDPSDPKNKLYLDFLSKLNVTDVNFPCDISDVVTLISNNQHLDIKVHLMCFHEKHIYPIKLNIGNGSKEVHLLIIDIEENLDLDVQRAYNGFGHSLLITSLDEFLKKTYYKNGLRTGSYKPKWCLNCCNSFNNEENLQKHKVSLQLHNYFDLYVCLSLWQYLSIRNCSAQLLHFFFY